MRHADDLATYFHTIARDTDEDGLPRCIKCGEVADDVHEILPRSFFGPSKKDILFDINNRCCVCRRCHGELHNDKGRVILLHILQDRHGYQYEGYAQCLLDEYAGSP
jgi:hypothetical protein